MTVGATRRFRASACASIVLLLGASACRSTNVESSDKSPVPVLLYQQVIPDGVASHYVTPEALFREHMAYLARQGFVTVLPDQYRALLEEGKALPVKPVMLTFEQIHKIQKAHECVLFPYVGLISENKKVLTDLH